MKKIAIITMTCGINYGNALQNYAVLKLIEKSGYSVNTISNSTTNGNLARPNDVSFVKKIHPRYILDWYHNKLNTSLHLKNDCDFTFSNIKEAKVSLDTVNQAIELKKKKFNYFQKNSLNYSDFSISNKNYYLEKLNDYSAFVTGSDQVWNPYYRTNSEIEFLQFAPKEKRIAFVPSFGISKLPDEVKDKYRKWINEIPFLSVRENEGAQIIKELTNKDVEVLLDPTFGLSKDEWIDFAKKPDNCTYKPNNYVFCYFLGNRTFKYTKFIKEYVRKNNCEIVDVYDVKQLNNYSYSPQEFIWLLLNSKAIFTDSFHGCALSINLNKPFVVFDRVGDGCITQSSRVSTVLLKFNLENNRFGSISIDNINDIDCKSVNSIIEIERNKQLDFLKKSLNNVIESKKSPKLAYRTHCTGCEACYNVCPSKAIETKEDEEGFLYPSIDGDKCINCRKCESVCPLDKEHKNNSLNKGYYAYSKDKEICKTSSSGGIFSELARNILNSGGIVFGAGFNDKFEVCHQKIETIEDLYKLKTSKYVQSRIGSIYSEIKYFLDNERKVLFSGTPCQISGLKSFLGKEYENLLLVDIVCHGVPSPMIWKKYLQEEHGNKNISKISFRNKDLGWNDFSMKVEYEDGMYYRELATKDPFEKSFLANLTLRPSCYQCQYKTIERESDITLADYWGVETVHPELANQQGVSLVITHTSKGEKYVENIQEFINCGETDIDKATKMNSAINNSVKYPQNREAFFKMQNNVCIKDTTNHYLKKPLKKRIINLIYRCGSKAKRMFKSI